MRTYRKYKTRFFLSALILFFLTVSFSGCGTPQFRSPMFQYNDYTTWGPNALTWNGRDLILGDRNLVMEINFIDTERYMAVDFLNEVEGYFRYARDPSSISSVKNLNISGLAWEGESASKGYLWVADSNNRQIVKLNANYEVLQQFDSPAEFPRGLAYDGNDLWVADAKNARIFKMSAADGSVLNEYQSPIKTPVGLAWDCEGLWILGMDSCKTVTSSCYEAKLVKLDIKTGKVMLEAGLPGQVVRPTAITWVDGILWVGDSQSNRIFRISAGGSSSKDDTVYLRK